MIRYLRMFYVGWIGLITGAIVLQLYLAGYGVFAFNGLNGFGPHFLVGDLIGIAFIVALALAFAARMPWRSTAVNAGLVVLMVVQFLLAHTPFQALSALHVVNGVLIFVLTLYLVWHAARFVWPSRVQTWKAEAAEASLDLAGAKAPHT